MLNKTIRLTQGETVKVSNQWAAEAEKRGTSVSSSVWSWYGAGDLTDETLSGTLATAMLAPTCTGLLVNTVNLANGEVLVMDRSVFVARY